MNTVHELLQPNDKVFWSNGKHTVFLNNRDSIKVLDHATGKKYDYFNDGIYGKVWEKGAKMPVPKRAGTWCAKLHEYITQPVPRVYLMMHFQVVKDMNGQYELIEYGKIKK